MLIRLDERVLSQVHSLIIGARQPVHQVEYLFFIPINQERVRVLITSQYGGYMFTVIVVSHKPGSLVGAIAFEHKQVNLVRSLSELTALLSLYTPIPIIKSHPQG